MGMIVVFLYLVYMLQGGKCGCSQRFATVFHSANHRAMTSHAFQWKMVSSPVLCGRDCALIPQCTSFNYRKTGRLCELNNATRTKYPADFKEAEGKVYYDDNLDTPTFSLPDIDNSSCKMLLRAGRQNSGIYTIFPAGIKAGVSVYCDMETDGGGWIVFQRRIDGTENFYRTWEDYQSGFGVLSDEFWLGNDILRKLTASSGQWQLRVDLRDWDANDAHATYRGFSVSGDDYILHLDSYVRDQGGAGDSLLYHSGRKFTTTGRDNDGVSYNCGDEWKGGWWFWDCFASHLNGVYLPGPTSVHGKRIAWRSWKGLEYSLKESSMKIRELVYTRL